MCLEGSLIISLQINLFKIWFKDDPISSVLVITSECKVLIRESAIKDIVAVS